jgi:8-amino-7-oxononanoate synthase
MWRDSPLERRVAARLGQWQAEGLLRTLRSPAGVDLSSNDYLNLSQDARVAAAFRAGVAREGVGSTGSRLLRGERDCFEAVERRFARFKGTERALYFSTGYLANIAVLTALTEPGDVIFSDALNHASLIDGIRLSRARRVLFQHNDVGDLATRMRDEPCDGIRFVVIETLFSMNGDLAPIDELAALCRANHAVLIADEAHAVGIYGGGGSGLLEAAALMDDVVCLSVNAAGKGLGVAGAFVAGPAWAVECLVQRARPFVFSTAPPPALADAIEASLSIVEDEPQHRLRLRDRAAFVRRRLLDEGLPVSPSASQIVPIIVGDNRRAVAIADALQADGFDVRAIRPPTVAEGTARLRVSVNAALSEETLDRFVRSAAAAFRRTGPSWLSYQPSAVSS